MNININKERTAVLFVLFVERFIQSRLLRAWEYIIDQQAMPSLLSFTI